MGQKGASSWSLGRDCEGRDEGQELVFRAESLFVS